MLFGQSAAYSGRQFRISIGGLLKITIANYKQFVKKIFEAVISDLEEDNRKILKIKFQNRMREAGSGIVKLGIKTGVRG